MRECTRHKHAVTRSGQTHGVGGAGSPSRMKSPSLLLSPEGAGDRGRGSTESLKYAAALFFIVIKYTRCAALTVWKSPAQGHCVPSHCGAAISTTISRTVLSSNSVCSRATPTFPPPAFRLFDVEAKKLLFSSNHRKILS